MAQPEVDVTESVAAIRKIKFGNETHDVYDSRIPDIDTTPTSGSENMVTSGGIYTALASKANASDVPSGALTTAEIQAIWDDVMSSLISFTINGTAYQAEDGMTWHEWVSSAYNTGGFYSDGAASYSYVRAQNGQTISFNNASEKSLNVIVNERAYTYDASGGASND